MKVAENLEKEVKDTGYLNLERTAGCCNLPNWLSLINNFSDNLAKGNTNTFSTEKFP